jgi:hypothetical protein
MRLSKRYALGLLLLEMIVMAFRLRLSGALNWDEQVSEPPQSWQGMVLLPQRWQTLLRDAGESGMGYHTGDVYLRNGAVFQDVAFMNPYVGGVRGRPRGDIPFDVTEIDRIDIAHKRWKWEW